MKRRGLSLFLLGWREVSAPKEDSIDVLNLCLANGIQYNNFHVDEEGSIFFSCSARSAAQLKRRCAEKGLSLTLGQTHGLLGGCTQLLHRPGLILGALACILLLLASGRFVWDIRVTGNNTMSREEVLQALREEGLYVGAYIPALEPNALSNRVMLNSDRISWLSVYMKGTVGVVQIIEATSPPAEEGPKKPANLIAKYDGQIEYVELYRGNCIVHVGEAVRKGDLLVSGLYDSPGEGYAWTRAAGSVLARTEHEICIEIPLSYSEKVYTEERNGGFLLSFFDFSLNFSKKCGNEEASCDIIEKEKCFSFFGEPPLPLSLTYYVHKPYTMTSQMRSHEEALERAYQELDKRLSDMSPSMELIDKRVVCTFEDDRVILVCTITCIEDIAVQSEFEITEIP